MGFRLAPVRRYSVLSLRGIACFRRPSYTYHSTFTLRFKRFNGIRTIKPLTYFQNLMTRYNRCQ